MRAFLQSLTSSQRPTVSGDTLMVDGDSSTNGSFTSTVDGDTSMDGSGTSMVDGGTLRVGGFCSLFVPRMNDVCMSAGVRLGPVLTRALGNQGNLVTVNRA
jgi:hypothetical protein